MNSARNRLASLARVVRGARERERKAFGSVMGLRGRESGSWPPVMEKIK
jgi:hypothetical protein